jgi:hypothetical protein
MVIYYMKLDVRLKIVDFKFFFRSFGRYYLMESKLSIAYEFPLSLSFQFLHPYDGSSTNISGFYHEYSAFLDEQVLYCYPP